jgi:hypothetical protein
VLLQRGSRISRFLADVQPNRKCSAPTTYCIKEEVRETVDLYLDGKIEQWYSLQGKPGVAFIINVTDPAVAREMIEKLPLGKAHMMGFELIPIGPLNPLRFLQGMQPNP